MELILVLLILSITSVISIDTIATFEANQRAERGARETLAFFRYARHLAMTTGKQAKVEINSANRTICVYWKSNGIAWDAAPVAQSMAPNGTMKLDFATSPELAGISLSVTPSGTTSFIYSALGACNVRATLTFTCGTKAKSLVVPMIGDPQLN
jgi:Tfp pilus assembly protein FimT